MDEKRRKKKNLFNGTTQVDLSFSWGWAKVTKIEDKKKTALLMRITSDMMMALEIKDDF